MDLTLRAEVAPVVARAPVSLPSNTEGNSLWVESHAINFGDVSDGNFRVEDALPSAELFQVSTDYFRLTCDDSHSAERLALECVAIMREFHDRGDRRRPWRYMGGYDHGWSCGPIAYAEGHSSVLVQASSLASDPLFLACKRAGLVIKPTRIDPQVTVQLPADEPGYARQMAEIADVYRRSGVREGFPFKVHLRDGKGDGDTLEMGTRGSEVYLRLYDKHREGFKKPHRKTIEPGQFPVGTWRFEGELKGGAAMEMYSRLCEAPSLSDGVLREVRGLFSDHGIEVPIGEGKGLPVREVKHRSDVDRTRAWLRSSVRPSIEQLIADGYLGEVLSDLGLGEQECVDLARLLLSRPVPKR